MSRRTELDLLSTQLAARAPAAAAAGLDYALRENAELIRALCSMRRYVHWLSHRMPGLSAEDLLEINELLPEWDEPIHRNILHIERVRWPAYIRPLVQGISRRIIAGDRPMTVVDLGAGAMETERQVLCHLHKSHHRWPITFVGIDASPNALRQARQNLASVGDHAQLIEAGLEQTIELISKPAPASRLILCRASAAALDQILSQSADLLFHSFFKHHLGRQAREQLDATTSKAAKTVLEYDGYKSPLHLLAISLLTWRSPAFLAGYIMSHARFQTRQQLQAQYPTGLRMHKNGCYLLEKAHSGSPTPALVAATQFTEARSFPAGAPS